MSAPDMQRVPRGTGMQNLARPEQEDVAVIGPHDTELCIYWCYPGNERRVGHWYAQVSTQSGRTGRKFPTFGEAEAFIHEHVDAATIQNWGGWS